MKNLFIPKKLLSHQERKTVLAFLNGLQKEEGGELLKQVVLFGSKARGDSKKDSDIDLLAVVKNKKAEGKVYEVVAKTLSLFGVYLSVKTFPQKEFEKFTQFKTPFMENVNREGIVLWPRQ